MGTDLSLEDVEEQDYSEDEADDPQRLWDDEEEQDLPELFGLFCDDSHARGPDALLGDAGSDQTAGHHQKAADLLGISRRTLTRKLKLYRADAAEDSIHAD